MPERNVIFIPPCQLSFVRMTGPYQASSVAAWQRLLDWLSDRGHSVIDEVGFGFALDDPRITPAENLRYDACVKSPVTWSDADAAFVGSQHFGGGAYFKIAHRGSYGMLGRAVSQARNVLLPREGLMHDASRPVLTMNYSYPSTTPPEEQLADICIPVLPDRRLEPRVDGEGM